MCEALVCCLSYRSILPCSIPELSVCGGHGARESPAVGSRCRSAALYLSYLHVADMGQECLQLSAHVAGQLLKMEDVQLERQVRAVHLPAQSQHVVNSYLAHILQSVKKSALTVC